MGDLIVQNDAQASIANMLKEVGTKDQASTVFIPHAPGAVGDIQSQMRQGFMEANAMATAQTRPTVARPSA